MRWRFSERVLEAFFGLRPSDEVVVDPGTGLRGRWNHPRGACGVGHARRCTGVQNSTDSGGS